MLTPISIVMDMFCVSTEKRIPLKLEYDQYGSALTPDRLIQLSAFAIDKETRMYHKADKTIVLDVPDLDIKVWED